MVLAIAVSVKGLEAMFFRVSREKSAGWTLGAENTRRLRAVCPKALT
jgi:hypothetical protein